MEIKILRQAIEYAPEKVLEFILNLYIESPCKDEIEAKFNNYFTNGGSLLPPKDN